MKITNTSHELLTLVYVAIEGAWLVLLGWCVVATWCWLYFTPWWIS